MERIPGGSDHLYQSVIDFYLEGLKQSSVNSQSPTMTKTHLRLLAQSDHERECIKYAVFKSSGLSPSAARRFYGLTEMARRTAGVEQAITEAERLHEVIDDLAATQDKALLLSYGIHCTSSSSSDSDSEETQSGADLALTDIPGDPPSSKAVNLTTLPLQDIVEKSKSNFFHVAEETENRS